MRYSGTAIGTQLGFLAAGFTPLVSASAASAKARTAGSRSRSSSPVAASSRPLRRRPRAKPTSVDIADLGRRRRACSARQDNDRHADQRGSDHARLRSSGPSRRSPSAPSRGGRCDDSGGVSPKAFIRPGRALQAGRCTAPWHEPLRCSHYGRRGPQGNSGTLGPTRILSQPEYLDACGADQPAARAVLHPRRCLRHRRRRPTMTVAFLAAHGPAVIVTINYRLGPLGFLQLAARHVSSDEANNLAITDVACRARLGARQYRQFRRRSGPDHAVGPVGRRVDGDRADDAAAGAREISPRARLSVPGRQHHERPTMPTEVARGFLAELEPAPATRPIEC